MGLSVNASYIVASSNNTTPTSRRFSPLDPQLVGARLDALLQRHHIILDNKTREAVLRTLPEKQNASDDSASVADVELLRQILTHLPQDGTGAHSIQRHIQALESKQGLENGPSETSAAFQAPTSTDALLSKLQSTSNEALAKMLLDNAEILAELPPTILSPKTVQRLINALYADKSSGSLRSQAEALLRTRLLRQPLLNSVPFNFEKNSILASDPTLGLAARGYAIRMLAGGKSPGAIEAELNSLFSGANPLWLKLPDSVVNEKRPVLGKTRAEELEIFQRYYGRRNEFTQEQKHQTLRRQWLTYVLGTFSQHKKNPDEWIQIVTSKVGTINNLAAVFPPPKWTWLQGRMLRDPNLPTPQPWEEYAKYDVQTTRESKKLGNKIDLSPSQRSVYNAQYDRIFGKNNDRVVVPIDMMSLPDVKKVLTWLNENGYSSDHVLWKKGRAVQVANPGEKNTAASRPVNISRLLKDAPEDVRKAFERTLSLKGKQVVASRDPLDIAACSTKTPALQSCLTLDTNKISEYAKHVARHVKEGTIVLYVVPENDTTMLRPEARQLLVLASRELEDGQTSPSTHEPVLLSPENGRLYGDQALASVLIQASAHVKLLFNPSPEPGWYARSDIHPEIERQLVSGEQWNKPGANLSDLSQPKANMRYANFEKATLMNANLQGADLTNALLTGANLSQANLGRANLHMANLNKANLSEVNLTGANLQDALLKNANLAKADLRTARLTNANLTNANLNQANLQEVDLTRQMLSDTNLTEANLIDANLTEAFLRGTNFTGANLSKANMTAARLHQANMASANLSGATLTSAYLKEAQLQNANLQAANLENANLKEADLQGANLRGANLTNLFFNRQTNFKGADLRGAQGITPELAAQLHRTGALNVPKPDLPGISSLANPDINTSPTSLLSRDPVPSSRPSDGTGRNGDPAQQLIPQEWRTQASPIAGPAASRQTGSSTQEKSTEKTSAPPSSSRTVVVGGDTQLTPSQREQLLQNLGINTSGIRKDLLANPDLESQLRTFQTTSDQNKARASIERWLKLKGIDVSGLNISANTGGGQKPSLEMPLTSSPASNRNDRESPAPKPTPPKAVPAPQTAPTSKPDPVLTRALSVLNTSTDPSAVFAQWAKPSQGSTELRALLSQEGLVLVLRYGLAGKMLTGLSQNGRSQYLVTYDTARVLEKIIAKPQYNDLQPHAQAMLSKVRNVLGAADQGSLSGAISELKRTASTPNTQKNIVLGWIANQDPRLGLMLGTTSGLRLVLDAGVGSALIAGLRQSGRPQLLSFLNTNYLLRELAQENAARGLAAQKLLRQVNRALQTSQVLHETKVPPTPKSSAPSVRATTPSETMPLTQGPSQARMAEIDQLKTQVRGLIDALAKQLNDTGSTLNALQRQSLRAVLSGLEKAQAWLSDSQRAEDAKNFGQSAWHAGVSTITTLIGGAALLLELGSSLVFQPQT